MKEANKRVRELDEALRRGTIILKGMLGHYEDCGVDCHRCKVATEKAKQILDLKGENWQIAIINPQKSSTFNKQYKLVIWEGE